MLPRNAVLAIAFGAAASGGLLFAQTPKLDLSGKALTAVAIKYVAEYEKQFAFLIADETYTQTVFDANGRKRQARTLTSELFLTYLPADGEWIAVRDVMAVDGEPVKDREDLRALLATREERPIVRELSRRNARFNIGIERTFNEPTLPLLLLDAKRAPRVKFSRRSVVRDGETTLAVLEFEERDPPMLVSWLYERGIPARGEFVLDAATGTVRGTTFLLKRPGTAVRLETSYTRNDKLKLWLPAVFKERYESGAVGGLRLSNATARVVSEVVEGEATYTNYRRFEVTGRIKGPGVVSRNRPSG